MLLLEDRIKILLGIYYRFVFKGIIPANLLQSRIQKLHGFPSGFTLLLGAFNIL
jgi:hypothetical protein